MIAHRRSRLAVFPRAADGLLSRSGWARTDCSFDRGGVPSGQSKERSVRQIERAIRPARASRGVAAPLALLPPRALVRSEGGAAMKLVILGGGGFRVPLVH